MKGGEKLNCSLTNHWIVSIIRGDNPAILKRELLRFESFQLNNALKIRQNTHLSIGGTICLKSYC